ncbi:MAG TPA: hypothetical protein VFF30_14630 [Nitrososphaerales archaeon]|nr:hypothetical protein [Nitrososphaerales archaeon]
MLIKSEHDSQLREQLFPKFRDLSDNVSTDAAGISFYAVSLLFYLPEHFGGSVG